MIRYDFSGRVAFVTGGTSGIGLAIARAFAHAGARVAIAARSEDAGRHAAEILRSDGADAVFVQTDVRDDASVARAVSRTVERFGRLDAAANCAGIGGDMAPLEMADQRIWDDVMATNTRGVWLAMRHEIPAMLASGGGAIVNMASIYAAAGTAAHHAYVASKHAVVGLTRSVGLEYAPRGVRVNAICAGATRTAAMRGAETQYPAAVAALVAEHPIGRMASEEEIAGAALWLCSEGSSYTTASAIAIDGGFLAA